MNICKQKILNWFKYLRKLPTEKNFEKNVMRKK